MHFDIRMELACMLLSLYDQPVKLANGHEACSVY
jgi:hypothetical protein